MKKAHQLARELLTGPDLRRVRDALKSANDMCRSAMEVARRDGKETNWEPFRDRLRESLEAQHRVMHPDQHEDIALVRKRLEAEGVDVDAFLARIDAIVTRAE